MTTLTRLAACFAACAALVVLTVPVLAQEPALSVLNERISLELKNAEARDFFRTIELIAKPLPGPSALEAKSVVPTGSSRVAEQAKAKDKPQTPEKPLIITVDEDFHAALSICLRQITLRTALRAACESMACRLTWREDNAAVHLRISKDPTQEPAQPPESSPTPAPSLDELISLNLEDANLHSVLQLIGKASGMPLVISAEVADRPVSIRVDKSVRECLDLICQQAGCRWKLLDNGKIAVSAK
jgi:hypothetical protein